jgi:hypothetical protein
MRTFAEMVYKEKRITKATWLRTSSLSVQNIKGLESWLIQQSERLTILHLRSSASRVIMRQ